MKPLLLQEIKQALRGEYKTSARKKLITGVTTDSRTVAPGDLFVALHGEHFDGHEFIDQAVAGGAVAVVADRNIPISPMITEHEVCLIKVDDTLIALGDLARFYRRSLGRSLTVIAVTGSNGKTTTREMIYHTLGKNRKGHRSPGSFNNSVGVPLTLLGVERGHDFVVVEIGSNAPGEVAALSRIAQPDIAVITSVGQSHLAGLKDTDGVSVEKVAITAGLDDHGVIICGTDHQPTLDRIKALGRRMISFGFDPAADVGATKVRRLNGHMLFETNDHIEIDLPMGGRHNVSNALAALAAVRRLGITNHDFARAMQDFTPVAQRMIYKEVNGITVIDDTYNANPSSMAVALDELLTHPHAPRRVMIVGDMGELGPESDRLHQQLGRDIAAANIDLFLAVGPQAALAATAALEAGMGWGSVTRSVSSKRLARLVKSMIHQGDVIMVKGSRMMEMEKVVESLLRFRPPPSEQTPTPRRKRTTKK